MLGLSTKTPLLTCSPAFFSKLPNSRDEKISQEQFILPFDYTILHLSTTPDPQTRYIFFDNPKAHIRPNIQDND